MDEETKWRYRCCVLCLVRHENIDRTSLSLFLSFSFCECVNREKGEEKTNSSWFKATNNFGFSLRQNALARCIPSTQCTHTLHMDSIIQQRRKQTRETVLNIARHLAPLHLIHEFVPAHKRACTCIGQICICVCACGTFLWTEYMSAMGLGRDHTQPFSHFRRSLCSLYKPKFCCFLVRMKMMHYGVATIVGFYSISLAFLRCPKNGNTKYTYNMRSLCVQICLVVFMVEERKG